MKCQEIGQCCPHLLDLIPGERKQQVRWREDGIHGFSELELRLGPPGGGEWSNNPANKDISATDESILYGGYFPNPSNGDHGYHHGDLSTGIVEKKTGSSALSSSITQKRFERDRSTSAVVGWPPIHSFRKNLATTFTKQTQEPSNPPRSAIDKPVESSRKRLFVKINMDGIPIGRKVDLSAYNCYEHLCSAVVELFRGLLTAQVDNPFGHREKIENEVQITGLLCGHDDYVLVYEDNEGDRVLVGDIPWQMFVSTAKRLRVIRSSEISSLHVGRRDGAC